MSTPAVGAPAGTTGATDGAEVIERSTWIALAVVTLVSFLVVVDVSVVNVAFPAIRSDLNASETSLSWIISGYNIGVATFLLMAGRLADSIGRRKVFLPGVALFMVGSALCGLAPNVTMLILARLVKSLGGAALLPSALAVVLPEFPFSRRSTAIGIFGAMGSLGAAFGPPIGSLLIEAWSWRGVFLINVPICLLVLIIGPRLLRDSKDPRAKGRMDVIGVPIGTVAVALVMLAIVESGKWGFGDARTIGLLVVGLALIPLLVWRAANHPESLLDLSLFKIKSFAASIVGVAFYSMAFTSGFLISSLLLQDLWQLSVVQTGLALTPSPLLAAATSVVAGRWADRIGHRWLITAGCLSCAAGYGSYLMLLDEQRSVLQGFMPGSLLIGLGTGLSIASWFSASVSDVDPGRFGVANATLRTVQQVFYAVGISVVITLIAGNTLSGYRNGWIWVVVMFVVAAGLVFALFPAGSSEARRAAQNQSAAGPAATRS